MGFTGVVWASRDLRILAQDLINGAGAAPMGEAGETWVKVARELADIAVDYRALLDKLGESWSSGGSEAARASLVEFGKWLDSVALNAATNAERAQSAAVAYGVAVIAMPTVPDAIKLREAMAVGQSLDGYPNGLMVGALGAADAAVQAATADAVAIMNSYENTVTPLAQPWTEPAPPDIAKSAAQKADKESSAAGSGAGGAGVGAAGAGGMAAAPLGAHRGRSVATTGSGTRVMAASTASPAGATGAPMAPMGQMGRGSGDDRAFESNRPAAVLSDAGEHRPAASVAMAASTSAFSVDSVSWGPQTTAFSTPADGSAEDAFDPDAGQLERSSSDAWVSPSVLGERGGGS